MTPGKIAEDTIPVALYELILYSQVCRKTLHKLYIQAISTTGYKIGIRDTKMT